MFTKIKQIITENKSFLIKIAIFLWIYFFLSDLSFASSTWVSEQREAFEKAKSIISSFWIWASTMFSVFLWLMTYLVTLFLSPEWISGNIFWLSSKLKEISILVSNVVYLAFAFILVFIAFANIVWLWWDKYQLKQALPKFIVWILIVPFSWFIVQFLVAISSILTVAAMNLPFDTFKWYKTALDSVEVPSQCTINLQALWDSTWDNKTWTDSSSTPNNKIYSCEPWAKKKISELLKSDNAADGIFGIMSLYTYWVVQLESIDKIAHLDMNTIKTIWDLLVKVVFDLLFVVVYCILMVALWLALMIRWIWLWIYMMLAPLLWLMYFFDKSWWWEWFFSNFNFKELISLAMVPFLTMLALSFGLLFIHTVWTWLTERWPTISSLSDTFKIESIDNWEWQKIVVNNNFTLTIKWAVSASKEITWLISQGKDVALWIVWSLILKIFWIVVLWWTFMAAINSSKITKAIVEPISSFWSQVWKLATQIPQYTPILPWWQSLKSLQEIPNLVTNQLSTKLSEQRNRASKFMWFSDETVELKELNTQIWNLIKRWNITEPEKVSFYNEIISKLNSTNLRTNDWKELVVNAWKIVWLNLDAKNLNSNEKLYDALRRIDEKIAPLDWRNVRSRDEIRQLIERTWTATPNLWWTSSWWTVNTSWVININLANKQISLPNNPDFKLTSDADSVTKIANEIKQWLWNETISKSSLVNSLKAALSVDNENDERIQAIIRELWNKVSN